MLNSAENEIFSTNKYENANKKEFAIVSNLRFEIWGHISWSTELSSKNVL